MFRLSVFGVGRSISVETWSPKEILVKKVKNEKLYHFGNFLGVRKFSENVTNTAKIAFLGI